MRVRARLSLEDCVPSEDFEDYGEPILKHMFEMERKTCTATTCMPTPPITNINNPDITPKMRQLLTISLSEIQDLLELRPETFQLAVNIMDRATVKMKVVRAEYYLLGLTSLWIAAKYEETHGRVPSLKTLTKISANKYNESTFKRFESKILVCLQFDIGYPTMESFFKFLLKANGNDLNVHSEVRNIARYFMELSLTAYNGLFMAIRPSIVAHASLLLAQQLYEESCVLSAYKTVPPRQGSALSNPVKSQAIIRELNVLMQLLLDAAELAPQRIFKKYEHQRYDSASLRVHKYLCSEPEIPEDNGLGMSIETFTDAQKNNNGLLNGNERKQHPGTPDSMSDATIPNKKIKMDATDPDSRQYQMEIAQKRILTPELTTHKLAVYLSRDFDIRNLIDHNGRDAAIAMDRKMVTPVEIVDQQQLLTPVTAPATESDMLPTELSESQKTQPTSSLIPSASASAYGVYPSYTNNSQDIATAAEPSTSNGQVPHLTHQQLESAAILASAAVAAAASTVVSGESDAMDMTRSRQPSECVMFDIESQKSVNCTKSETYTLTAAQQQQQNQNQPLYGFSEPTAKNSTECMDITNVMDKNVHQGISTSSSSATLKSDGATHVNNNGDQVNHNISLSNNNSGSSMIAHATNFIQTIKRTIREGGRSQSNSVNRSNLSSASSSKSSQGRRTLISSATIPQQAQGPQQNQLVQAYMQMPAIPNNNGSTLAHQHQNVQPYPSDPYLLHPNNGIPVIPTKHRRNKSSVSSVSSILSSATVTSVSPGGYSTHSMSYSTNSMPVIQSQKMAGGIVHQHEHQLPQLPQHQQHQIPLVYVGGDPNFMNNGYYQQQQHLVSGVQPYNPSGVHSQQHLLFMHPQQLPANVLGTSEQIAIAQLQQQQQQPQQQQQQQQHQQLTEQMTRRVVNFKEAQMINPQYHGQPIYEGLSIPSSTAPKLELQTNCLNSNNHLPNGILIKGCKVNGQQQQQSFSLQSNVIVANASVNIVDPSISEHKPQGTGGNCCGNVHFDIQEPTQCRTVTIETNTYEQKRVDMDMKMEPKSSGNDGVALNCKRSPMPPKKFVDSTEEDDDYEEEDEDDEEENRSKRGESTEESDYTTSDIMVQEQNNKKVNLRIVAAGRRGLVSDDGVLTMTNSPRATDTTADVKNPEMIERGRTDEKTESIISPAAEPTEVPKDDPKRLNSVSSGKSISSTVEDGSNVSSNATLTSSTGPGTTSYQTELNNLRIKMANVNFNHGCAPTTTTATTMTSGISSKGNFGIVTNMTPSSVVSGNGIAIHDTSCQQLRKWRSDPCILGSPESMSSSDDCKGGCDKDKFHHSQFYQQPPPPPLQHQQPHLQHIHGIAGNVGDQPPPMYPLPPMHQQQAMHFASNPTSSTLPYRESHRYSISGGIPSTLGKGLYPYSGGGYAPASAMTNSSDHYHQHMYPQALVASGGDSSGGYPNVNNTNTGHHVHQQHFHHHHPHHPHHYHHQMTTASHHSEHAMMHSHVYSHSHLHSQVQPYGGHPIRQSHHTAVHHHHNNNQQNQQYVHNQNFNRHSYDGVGSMNETSDREYLSFHGRYPPYTAGADLQGKQCPVVMTGDVDYYTSTTRK